MDSVHCGSQTPTDHVIAEPAGNGAVAPRAPTPLCDPSRTDCAEDHPGYISVRTACWFSFLANKTVTDSAFCIRDKIKFAIRKDWGEAKGHERFKEEYLSFWGMLSPDEVNCHPAPYHVCPGDPFIDRTYLWTGSIKTHSIRRHRKALWKPKWSVVTSSNVHKVFPSFSKRLLFFFQKPKLSSSFSFQ